MIDCTKGERALELLPALPAIEHEHLGPRHRQRGAASRKDLAPYVVHGAKVRIHRWSIPVELFDEVAVGFSGCFELFFAVGQIGAEGNDLLFELRDVSFELFDVVGCAQSALAPDLIAEQFGELLLRREAARMFADGMSTVQVAAVLEVSTNRRTRGGGPELPAVRTRWPRRVRRARTAAPFRDRATGACRTADPGIVH
ncbi:hypothetical protein GCM10022225_44890 [Plantactinospora mayteni]|uniref:Uncharacterized protein n=1 Tax=Plantactinospora mayteni TaxID=566021 RepID=A0ABQ4EXN3_9ACTN|nr:hypothetical protein [Plantactinospora mayteni]GIG99433.1 hypothetical protein Pma05_60060 [Plantactinospora mayteni]